MSRRTRASDLSKRPTVVGALARARGGWRAARRLFVVALGLLLLSGCGPDEPEPIRLWHAYRGKEEQTLQRLLAEWQGTPVDVLSIPHGAFAAKLSAAIPLGGGPDLFIDAHERLGDYQARGLVVPVGDAYERSAEDPEGPFVPLAQGAVKLADGQRYGVPLSQKCVALYVNTDLIEQVPADLEGIAELRSSLPEGVVPLAYEAEDPYFHAAVLSAFGGALLGPDDQFGLVGADAERSLELVRGLIRDGVVPADADGNLVKQLFRAGRAAMAISGPWLATDLADADISYRVALLPAVRATGKPMRPLLTVESLMLSPAGARRADARALARSLAGAEAAQLWQRGARTVSARSDVAIADQDEFLRAFAAQARQAQLMPTAVAMRATWEPAKQAIRKVMRGDVGPREALSEAARRYQDVRQPLPPETSTTPALAALGGLAMLGALLLFRQARRKEFRTRLRRSLPAYGYVLHAVVALGLLVFVPLIAGAAISLYAGRPGAQHYVGLANFVEILTARGGPLFGHGSFYLVLLVTVAWAVLNVALHVAIGLLLGVVLSRPTMKLRGLYRVLLIVPWAVPSYVTALSWKGMFHRQFGAINGMLRLANEHLGTDLEPIAWFSRFSTAFAANVSTNVWLGFPFMMVVTIAALTAVPREVLEAAEVDGASRLQRFFMVTLPIIARSLLPSVLLGTIWTFNMFNVVFLVSGGEPDGQTDILVSEAYRWAFTRQARYGYAAAYSVLIFLLLFGATRLPSWLAGLRAERRAARLGAGDVAAAGAGGGP